MSEERTTSLKQFDPLEGFDWFGPVLRLYFWLVRW